MGHSVGGAGRTVFARAGVRERLSSLLSASDAPFWLILVFGVALLAAVAEIVPALRHGQDLALWRPVFFHFASALSVLAFVAPVCWLARRDWPGPRVVAAHAVLAPLFAGVHIGWTVGMYHVANAIEGADAPLILTRLHVEALREFVLYGLMVGLAAHRLRTRREDQASKPAAAGAAAIAVHSGRSLEMVRCDAIDRVSAAGNYVVLHVGEREVVHRSTMDALADRLPKDVFFRTHRSWFVNLRRVTDVREKGPRDHVAVLSTGATVPVSRRRRSALVQALSRET